VDPRDRTAALTAFYTWRMVALTFFGEQRFDHEHVHPHESPAVMTVPLAVLAVLAALGGALNLPHVLPGAGALEHWLEPVTAPGDALLWGGHARPAHLRRHRVAAARLGAAHRALFAHRGFHAYSAARRATRRCARRAGARALPRERLADRPLVRAAHRAAAASALVPLATLVDQLAIDGAVNGAARSRAPAGTLRARATAT
jgi:NADH-quinone oxidoreductase subunit L